MRHPFAAAIAAVVTAVLSFLVANIFPIPLWWTWVGFDKHNHYAYPLRALLGTQIPITFVVVAIFLVIFGAMTVRLRRDDAS